MQGFELLVDDEIDLDPVTQSLFSAAKRALARNAAFTSPRNGQLSVTVSFRNALEAEAGNRCATTRSLRTDRRGALRTP